LLRSILKSIGIVKEDYTKEYWKSVAEKKLPYIMDRITTDFTPDDFAQKKESIVFNLKIPFNKDQVVLDLACGLGRTCKWVAPQVDTYYGVDFIPDMIEKAMQYNKLHKNAFFYTNNGSNITSIFADNTVDIAYCELAFQHMPRDVQVKYINDLEKILKPDGKFYVQIPKLERYKRRMTSWNESEIHVLFKDWAYYQIVDVYPAYFTVIATAKVGFK
jgi:ubiquinone/menaquinone biosynthesis C-methylase UbiE